MSEKSNEKSRTRKGVKRGKGDKRKKGDTEANGVEKLLEKITIDTIIDAMEHKWLVAKSISTHIIGVYLWDKLSEKDKGIIIKRVNEIKLKTPGLM